MIIHNKYIHLLLQAYVQSEEEKYLVDIEQLGRKMVRDNVPLEEVVKLHNAAIAEVLASPQFSLRKNRAASTPLMQLLMPYDTAFRLACSREQLYQTLFESSMDAIMILNETCFIRGNEAAIQMFGCHSMDDFQGHHPAAFSPSTQPCGTGSISLANKHIAKAMKNGSHSFEWIHKRLNGTMFPAEVLLSALELDGQQRLLQATVRDISKRRQAEEQVRKLSSAIEQAGESALNSSCKCNSMIF